MNLLLSGRPRVGKTTICRVIMDRFPGNLRGFVTEDIRHEKGRMGFMVEFANGASRVLSHVDFEDGPRVSKYTVDLRTMDWVVEKMDDWQYDSFDLCIVDEIGKMELKHDAFPERVEERLDSSTDLLATVPLSGPDFVEEIKSRDDVENLEMTGDNREKVQRELIQNLELVQEGL